MVGLNRAVAADAVARLPHAIDRLVVRGVCPLPDIHACLDGGIVWRMLARQQHRGGEIRELPAHFNLTMSSHDAAQWLDMMRRNPRGAFDRCTNVPTGVRQSVFRDVVDRTGDGRTMTATGWDQRLALSAMCSRLLWPSAFSLGGASMKAALAGHNGPWRAEVFERWGSSLAGTGSRLEGRDVGVTSVKNRGVFECF